MSVRLHNIVVSILGVLSLARGPDAVLRAYSGPIGLSALEQIDQLPRLLPGVRSYLISSYGRVSANVDGEDYLYQDGAEYVMFEAEGPGCVYRFWATSTSGRFGNLRFYFDGETTPRFNITYDTLFAGNTPPFLSPLVKNDNVAGGSCYLPIPFRRSLKITSTQRPRFYQFDYHIFDDTTNVVTFTGAENSSAARAL